MNMFSYTKDVGTGVVFAVHAAVGYGLILILTLGYAGAGIFLGTWHLIAILAYILGFVWDDPLKGRTS
jgi:hypothetical protein